MFITNGPYQAIGSPIGRPPSSSTSRLGGGASCVWSARELQPVAVAVDRELALADRPVSLSGPTLPAPGEHVDERVEVGPPRHPQARARRESVACAYVIGVRVLPGPSCPSIAPAITRTHRAAVVAR